MREKIGCWLHLLHQRCWIIISRISLMLVACCMLHAAPDLFPSITVSFSISTQSVSFSFFQTHDPLDSISGTSWCWWWWWWWRRWCVRSLFFLTLFSQPEWKLLVMVYAIHSAAAIINRTGRESCTEKWDISLRLYFPHENLNEESERVWQQVAGCKSDASLLYGLRKKERRSKKEIMLCVRMLREVSASSRRRGEEEEVTFFFSSNIFLHSTAWLVRRQTLYT